VPDKIKQSGTQVTLQLENLTSINCSGQRMFLCIKD